MDKAGVLRVEGAVVGVVTIVAVAVALSLTEIGTEHQRLVVADLAEIAAPLLAAAAALRVARRSTGPERRGWNLLAAATTSWAVGQTCWTWFELVRHTAPFPSVADAGFLLAVPLGWASMAAFHGAWRRPSARGVAFIDGVTAASALLVVFWVYLLRPSWDASVPPFEAYLSLAYPAGGAITIAVVLSIMAGAHREARRPVSLITGGFLVLALADGVFAFLTLHGEPGAFNLADAGWIGGFLLLAVAASSGVSRAGDAPGSTSPLWLALLPYMPVTVALGVGLFDILPSGETDPVVLVAGVAMIAAILGRQASTMAENRSLLDQLAHKVVELEGTERDLRHQAFHDGLTGLANRELFSDRVQHALQRHRRGDPALAVLLIDLDDFKNVNDSLGHLAGDQLLIEVGRRMADTLRPGDTVARLGGDEFAVLLEDDVDPSLPERVAERLLGSLVRPIRLDAQTVTVHASLGYVIAGPEATADELLGDADLALYAAKDAGKRSARRFEPAMRSAAVDRAALSSALEHAAEGQLEVHYQTIHASDDYAVVGVEALVRWRHPTRGLLLPTTFVGLAEETGLIVRIGRSVLVAACTEAVTWRRTIPDLQVNVNVSGRQLLDDHLVADVADALRVSGLEPSALVLEITESVLTPPGPELLDRLAALKQLGVLLAVDDFGAGYSSLNYLRTLPVDVLKIDSVFLAATGDDEKAEVLLRAIIELGHSLDLVVVAEGIERRDQLALVSRLGCEQAQGYLLARPGPAEEVGVRLRLGTSPGAPVA